MTQFRVGIVVLSLVLSSAPLRSQAGPAARPEAVVDNGEFMDLFLKAGYTDLQQTMAKPPVERREWAAIYQKAIHTCSVRTTRRCAASTQPWRKPATRATAPSPQTRRPSSPEGWDQAA